MATILAEQLTTLMPTIIAQVTAAMGGNPIPNQDQGGGPGPVEEEVIVEPEQVNHEQEDLGPEVEFVADGMYVGPRPRGAARVNEEVVNPRGCTYPDFKKCGPPNYDGKGGAIVFVKWLEKMEAVMDISECAPQQKVRYTAGSFTDDALSWWNTQLQSRGRVAALGTPWDQFKEMMKSRFCPLNEMQKIEQEFWHHVMVGAGHAEYTSKYQELARLVPHLVTSESKLIERYIYGLIPQIRNTMTGIPPLTIEEAIQRSGAMTDDLVRAGTLTRAEKRRESLVNQVRRETLGMIRGSKLVRCLQLPKEARKLIPARYPYVLHVTIIIHRLFQVNLVTIVRNLGI
jgi:hypothetical protein